MASGLGIIMINKIKFYDKYTLESKGGLICEPAKGALTEAFDQYISNPNLLFIHGTRNRNVVRKLSIDEVARSWSEAICDTSSLSV